MDPTVTAAAIGVGGTVIVGVTGFRASIRNTSRTIRYARESRLWDRRADLDVETLKALNYRENQRIYEVQSSATDQDPEEQRPLETYLGAHSGPDWWDLVCRVYAFASGPVVNVIEASRTAHEQVMHRYYYWQHLEAEQGARSGVVEIDADADAAATAAVALSDALVAAEKADDAVLRLIRRELQNRGPLFAALLFRGP
jgi:hypothetical protein